MKFKPDSKELNDYLKNSRCPDFVARKVAPIINKLQGALMYKGGTGELTQEQVDLIISCTANGIILNITLEDSEVTR